jgi:predicted transposase YbfD/YdcC
MFLLCLKCGGKLIVLGRHDPDRHGRAEERSYHLSRIPSDLAPKKERPWVKAISFPVQMTRHADGRETGQVRYYTLSRYLGGKRFSEAVRGHWGIESVHWVLGVNFREDDSRARGRTLGNNLSWLRRFAVTLLKRRPVNDSLRGKMIRCTSNTDFLTEVLTLKGD